MAELLWFLLLALAPPQTSEVRSLAIAADQEFSTSVRLIETADSIQFEFTAPDLVLTSVSIDVNRNGVVDRNVDFQVTRDADGSSCLQYLLKEGASSICQPLGNMGKIVRSAPSPNTITTFSFEKKAVSGDGFGVGFAISLWDAKGNYGTTLASGDYVFGGKLQLTSEGPNFKGEKNPDLPTEILPAVRRYEGCLHGSIRALEPIDGSKAAKLKAVPAQCAATRQIALREGADALVRTGVDREVATKALQELFDQLDGGIDRLIEIVAKNGIKEGRMRP